MVNLLRIIILFNFLLIISSCSSNAVLEQDEIQRSYDKGVEFYDNKKYSKAKDSFQYVILHSMGSKLALDSEFYLSESLYNLEEYQEALYGYDNYARSSQDIKLIELSRFRLCQCAYNLTSDYNKDQTSTTDAIEKIEIFLEDYPQSEYHLDLVVLRADLEYKLAKKEYESAVLYIKLQEYDAALIYLFEVLNNYGLKDNVISSEDSHHKHDILLRELLDDVKILIIYGYLLAEKEEMAKSFYDLQKNNFYSAKIKKKAIDLLNNQIGTLDKWRDIYIGISK